MIIYEVQEFGNEKVAADALKKNADTMKKQADAAKAKLKIKDAQSKLVKTIQPIKPSSQID